MTKLKIIFSFMTAATIASATYAESYADSNIITVDQGWDYSDRAFFYFSPQGSPIIPFEFAKALEQPNSEELFLDPSFLKELGMIYWNDPKSNPENLPVGLTVDNGRLGNESFLGMNCSSCHVTEIKVGGKTALVDGGVSHFDFWSFMKSLNSALHNTYNDNEKFDRFAKRISEGSKLTKDSESIRANFRKTLRHVEDWSYRNHASLEPGPGRVDALNVILNQVTAAMLHLPSNARSPDAPVSYPFLWDAPYFDVVQYNGAVPNAGAGALARNIGQVLGVFGQVDITEGTIPLGYNSSVNVTHLIGLEKRLETLKSPMWADFAKQGLLPELDQNLVAKGGKIYDKECSNCHAPFDRDNRGDLAATHIKTFDLETIGTDPAAALGFSAREVVTGPVENRKIGVVAGEPFCEVTHGNAVLVHMVTAVMLNNLSNDKSIVEKSALDLVESSVHSKVSHLGQSIRSAFGFSHKEKVVNPDYGTIIDALQAKGLSNKEIAAALKKTSEDKSILFDELVKDHIDYTGADQACMTVVQTAQYRARPLDGIWATGPFLHNGSVPTLSDLLKPQESRPETFVVGNGQFDPQKVGFMPETSQTNFLFDTRLKGNSRAGHLYGTTLSEPEKSALLEYLKSL